MKIRSVVYAALFSLSMSCFAEVANPFVKKKDEAKTPTATPGPSFVGILEHILVPPDLIDEWTRQHGMPTDATALRAEVQKWVKEGKATLDCTTIATGVMGRRSSNERIIEQIFPTEYYPSGAGVWPLPTGFETRNLGYASEFFVKEVNGEIRFSVDADFHEMQGSKVWNQLMERTRHPDDVFMPVIRTYRVSQKNPGPNADGGDVDPFAQPSVPALASLLPPSPDYDFRPSFGVNGISLLARFDPLQAERKSGQVARLVFGRGSTDDQIERSPHLAENFRIAVATVRVPHLEFSQWLQQQPPLAVPQSAWQFAESLRKDGRAEIVECATTQAKLSRRNIIENISEIIYPTEWEPATHKTVLERWEERLPQKVDGRLVAGVATRANVKIEAVPGLAGASFATSFETRNTGMTYEILILPDEHGVMASHTFERVRLVGEAVYRRIEDQENWVPDITMPLFSTGRCATINRMIPGKWMLISTGPEYTESGKSDREHCVLMFVKVE